MALSGDHHGQSLLFAILDGIIIANGTTGLNECGDACLMTELYAIIEWEKGIAGEHCTLQIELKLF